MRAWKEEVDTLLVFVSDLPVVFDWVYVEFRRYSMTYPADTQAGLFSGIVTAFNIEAYKLLQADPSQVSIQLLQLISQQLAQGSNVTTTMSVPTGKNAFKPPTQSIRINALWFSSLICSLFSALMCIMVKQWLREYLAIFPPSPRHNVRFRQYRYDGLIAWRVPEIMALLPILLEFSLLLFLVGLVDFLFQLHHTVAAIATCLVATVLFFYIITTIAPTFSAPCPYKSPQAWLVVRLRNKLAALTHTLRSTYQSFVANQRLPPHASSAPAIANWSERDDTIVWAQRHDLDLEATTWMHTHTLDDDLRSSLVTTIPDLHPNWAITLVFSILAERLRLPATTLMNRIQERSCSALLRDAGTRFSKHTRKQTCDMLLKLLECVPRINDPSKLGPLDILWALWELCLGACLAEEQDPRLYQLVLDGVAQLLSQGNPYRLRRAALNILYESTHAWTFVYCPAGKSVGVPDETALTQHDAQCQPSGTSSLSPENATYTGTPRTCFSRPPLWPSTSPRGSTGTGPTTKRGYYTAPSCKNCSEISRASSDGATRTASSTRSAA